MLPKPGPTAGTSRRWPSAGAGRAALLVAGLALAACSSSEPSSSATPACNEPLFGRPVPATGLSDAQCGPTCGCGATAWAAPDYGDADIAAILEWQLLEPPAPITEDPYAGPPPDPPAEGAVCAIVPDPPGSRAYRLRTYASQAAAEEDGAAVTHFDACGACSTLADLAVYMRYPDLTAPVRQCGLENLGGPEDAHLACLEALGFQEPCAQIWYYNTLNTAAACGGPCFAALGAPYNQPDGSLNDCLQCDEDESGAVFKAVAGRTRRNTGIASAICRPCSEVRPLLHEYL